jgi:hypothetical protein
MIRTKMGVCAVKINFITFLSFIFSMLENETALILKDVTSQENCRSAIFDLYAAKLIYEKLSDTSKV